MFSSTRRWMRQNRTPIAIGVGIVGAGYVVTQYVMSKINDARERMSSDRIAKENLRRRFEQNQEDCTFTVLALLPTATTNILETMNTESITYEIQQLKSVKAVRSTANGDSPAPPSIADTTLTEEEGKSTTSVHSESGVHASQITLPPPKPANATGEGLQQDPAAAKPRKSKRQLWDELTISAITRAFTLIYTLALLSMLTRVQLNLLGRRSYLSSVVSLATSTQQATISLENHDDNTEQAYGSDFDTNRKYLTFSWWLLNKGWIGIMERVESAVRTVFGTLSPRDLISFDRFAELTLEVRRLVEGATPEERRRSDWLQFLLPPQDKEDEVIQASGILEENTPTQSAEMPSTSPATLRRLLDETADLIESPAFTHVLTLLLDTGFSSLVDRRLAAEAFEFPAQEGIIIPHNKELKRTKVVLLPKILSVLTRQAHVIGNGVPNEYLQEMESVRDLEAFAAVVYSSNWQNEVSQEGGLMDSAVHVDKPTTTTTTTTLPAPEGESSIVLVDRQEGLDAAWQRAVERQS